MTKTLEVTETRTRLVRNWPRKQVTYNGVTFRVYSRIWLAHMCGVTVKAVHKWFNDGNIPGPILKLTDDAHWFTAAEIQGYAKIHRLAGVKRGRFQKVNGETSLERFKRIAFKFHAELAQRIVKDTGSLPTELSDEEKILQSQITAKNPDWHKLIDKLIKP